MSVFTLTAAFAQDTLYVKPDDSSTAWADRTGVFTNLQDALDAALGGDQIWVAGGTYLPSIKFPNGSENRCKSFVLKSDVALYGGFAGTESDPSEREMSDSLFVFTNATILSGDINATPDDQTDNSYHVVYAATASNFILDGFTITGGYGNRQGYNNEQRGAGLYMGGNSESNHSTNSTVRYCTFLENTANQNGGAAYAPYTNRFESCFFNNNSVLATNSGGGALFFDHCTYLDTVAVNCYFYNNKCMATVTPTTSQRYGGGAVSCGSNCTFWHCTFFTTPQTMPVEPYISVTATSSTTACLSATLADWEAHCMAVPQPACWSPTACWPTMRLLKLEVPSTPQAAPAAV